MTINLIELRKASNEAAQETNKELEAKVQTLSSNEAKSVIEKLLKLAIPEVEMNQLKEIVKKTTNKNLALLAVIQRCSSVAKEVKCLLF